MGLIPVVLQNLPAIIELIKGFHQQANPGEPPPTDEEIHLALLQAVTSTIARDDQWLASHPAANTPPTP